MPVLAGGEGPKQGADASGKPYNQREANNSQLCAAWPDHWLTSSGFLLGSTLLRLNHSIATTRIR